MFLQTLLEVMKHPGVVAIATQGEDGPHLVNTWNNYIQITDGGRLVIPAGYMHETEANLARDNRVLMTLGSPDVAGKLGTAAFVASGPDFEVIKAKFEWARAALVVTVESVTQTL